MHQNLPCMLSKSLACVQEKTQLLKLASAASVEHTNSCITHTKRWWPVGPFQAHRQFCFPTRMLCSTRVCVLLERSVYTHSLLFICGDACLCVCSCTHIHIHVEAREQPQVSSLKSCPPLFWRSFLNGLELTGSARLANLQTPCISLPLPHLPSSPLHPKIASILYNILSFLMWILGFKHKSSWLQDKHFPD